MYFTGTIICFILQSTAILLYFYNLLNPKGKPLKNMALRLMLVALIPTMYNLEIEIMLSFLYFYSPALFASFFFCPLFPPSVFYFVVLPHHIRYFLLYNGECEPYRFSKALRVYADSAYPYRFVLDSLLASWTLAFWQILFKLA